MPNHPKKQSRHNFTNISDLDLKTGERVKDLSPLLYFRVLKTNELLERSSYPHSLKSFRKLLAKFEKMELIGAKREDPFSPKLIYPKEKLIREYRGNRWKEYFITDESLKRLKFYWQIGKLYRIMGHIGNDSEGKSYINSSGPWFDFHLKLKPRETMYYGLYANTPNGRSEEEVLETTQIQFFQRTGFQPNYPNSDMGQEIPKEIDESLLQGDWMD